MLHTLEVEILINKGDSPMRTQQEKIIAELGTRPSINPAEEVETRAQFLANYLGDTGMRGFVLGISGGQDSLLAGLLATRAVDIRRKEGNDAEFHAVLLPYGAQADRADALLAIDTISPDVVHDFNIKQPTDAFADSFAATEHTALRDYDKGNVKARMRMIAQYALASHHGLLVIGTDHAAEAVTGFYTKYGDGGADVLPLAGLTKRQGRQMLKQLGAPRLFTEKAPTADLLDTTPGQADETELGLRYTVIDDYLEGKEIEPELAAAIEQRFAMTSHKRTMPIAFTD